jgi:type I site-specific restriction endonuclease
MISWEEYLTEAVTLFRKEFEKLSPEKQDRIREKYFDNLPLKPCQIEVLEFEGEKGVVCLIAHDSRFPDMMFKTQKDVKSFEVSEFIKKYKYSHPLLSDDVIEQLLLPDSLHIITKNTAKITLGARQDFSPQDLAEAFLSSAKEVLKTEQVDVIKRSTEGLKESIAKISEKDVRDELLVTTEKIDGALQEIRRIDEEIGKVRQLVGVSQEYQDWRLLVSDVHRLKGEHVSKEVFKAKLDELDTRINSLAEIRGAYDKILAQQNTFMKQQSEVMKQQSSFITWIKYATILVPIALVSVPIIEILLRHFLGSS